MFRSHLIEKSFSVIVAALLWVPSGIAMQGQTLPVAEPADKAPPTSYLLGPDDQVSIHVLETPEISAQPILIDMDGYISLPMVGRFRAAGLTVEQLQTELVSRLKKYIQDPQVWVNVTEFRSQPVSIVGAVKNPGVYQIRGRKSLVEVLSMAGGLDEKAGYRLRISRLKEWGSIPLANATDDPTGQYRVAEVSVKDLLDATNPADNIQVRPYDVVTVPRGQMVYVIGEVKRSGGFVLGDRESMSVLQALSLAEGLQSTSAPQRAKILRSDNRSDKREEIAVDVKNILAGKAPDVPLQRDDILFIPTNVTKKAALRTLETALGIGTSITTGLVIYRR